MFRPFADWLSNTHLSQVFQNAAWVVPTSQSLHIIAVSVVFSSVCLIDLRLLGVGVRGRSLSQLTTGLAPWIWGGLCVLLFTGAVQTIAEPVRQFVTPAFWAKMTMLLIIASLTAVLLRRVAADRTRWDSAVTRPRIAAVFAVVSLLLWVGIITCGRFIGYTWSFYA